jgi:hypothetical protein
MALWEAVITVEFPAAPNPKEIPLAFEKRTVLVEAVDPLAAIPRIASPPPGLGAESQIVLGPPTAVDSLTVILFVPAMTQSIPVETPVFPAVFPVFDAPKALMAL